ncbi:hypothetical protein ACSQ67_025258 [Phaseolus vulgaris]
MEEPRAKAELCLRARAKQFYFTGNLRFSGFSTTKEVFTIVKRIVGDGHRRPRTCKGIKLFRLGSFFGIMSVNIEGGRAKAMFDMAALIFRQSKSGSNGEGWWTHWKRRRCNGIVASAKRKYWSGSLSRPYKYLTTQKSEIERQVANQAEVRQGLWQDCQTSDRIDKERWFQSGGVVAYGSWERLKKIMTTSPFFAA